MYSSQVGYVLTDAQYTQNMMRQMLKVVRAAELDPEAGRTTRSVTSSSQLALAQLPYSSRPGRTSCWFQMIQTLPQTSPSTWTSRTLNLLPRHLLSQRAFCHPTPYSRASRVKCPFQTSSYQARVEAAEEDMAASIFQVI